MKKQFLLILGIVFAITAYSFPVSKIDAKKNVVSFLRNKVSKNKAMLISPDFDILPVSIEGEISDEEPYYIFNIGNNNGFVIASGEDRTMPILGYVDNGSFDINNIPENMKSWLKGYEREINGIKNSKSLPMYAEPMYEDIRTTINPLLKSQWDQADPFNKKCYKKRPTGCVATAMAQVMYYHKWPKEATKEIPEYLMYEDPEDVMIQALEPITFKWDKMIDKYKFPYNAEEADAVADLMKYCGQSVEMEYGEYASGALSFMAATALKKYFDYDQGVTFLVQEGHSYEEWCNIVYNELSNNRPVLFAGNGAGGGHEFVCDGYKDGFFHFNWGWNGVSDGFFRLSSLSPGMQGIGGSVGGNYEFTSGQQIVIGIQPPVENTHAPEYKPTSGWIALGNYTDNGHIKLNSSGTAAIKVKSLYVYDGEDDGTILKVGTALYNKDNELLKVLSSKNVSFIAGYPIAGEHAVNSTVFIDPKYQEEYKELYIRPITFDDNGDAELILNSESNYIKLDVAEGEIIAKAYPEVELDVRNVAIGSMPVIATNILGELDPINLVASIKNSSSETIKGRLDVMVNNEVTYLTSGNETAYSTPQDISLRPGEKRNVAVKFNVTTDAINNICLAFDGKPISENIEVEFITPKVKSSRLEIKPCQAYVSNGDSLNIDLNIKNLKSKNVYETFLTVILYDLESNDIPTIVSSNTQLTYVDAKSSANYTFKFNNLDLNKGYGFAIQYIDANKTKFIGGIDFYTNMPNNIYKTYRTADAIEYCDAIGNFEYATDNEGITQLPNTACYVNYPSSLSSDKYIKSENPNCIYQFSSESNYPSSFTDNNVIKGNMVKKIHLTNDAPYYLANTFKCSDVQISFYGTKKLVPIYLPFVPDVITVDDQELTIASDSEDKDADCTLMPLSRLSSESLYFDYGTVDTRSIYLFSVNEKYEGKEVIFKINERKDINLDFYSYTFDNYDIIGPTGIYLTDKYNMYVYDNGRFIKYTPNFVIPEHENLVWLKMKNGYTPNEIRIHYDGEDLTSIENVELEDEGIAKIYSVEGTFIRSTKYGDDMLNNLPKGVYIINGKKYIK